MGSDKDETRPLTIRPPRDLHDALRQYANYKGKTMNSLVLRWVRDGLAAAVAEEDLRKMSSEAGAKFRTSLRRATKDN